MSDFYLHAVRASDNIAMIDDSLRDFDKILDTGVIFTRRSRGLVGLGFNGSRYISLADYDKRFDHVNKDDKDLFDYSAYSIYSTKSVSIMIDKTKVRAVTPTLIKPIHSSFISLFKMIAASNDYTSVRMTDLPDEVQVRGNIYYKAFMGVTIPSEEIISGLSPDKLRRVYAKVRELLERYEYQLGVYNVSDMQPIDSEKDVEEIIRRSR